MRKLHFIFINAAVSFLLLTTIAYASDVDKIKILAYEIPGVIENNNSGSYDKVISEISKSLKLNIEYLVQPTARVNVEFDSGSAECMFPVDVRFYENKKNFDLINSTAVNVAKVYIYTEKGVGPLHSVEELKGKQIGIKSGVPLGPKWEKSGLQGLPVISDFQNVEKLQAGRIDAFLAFVPDMNILINEKKITTLNFDLKKPFEIHSDALLCKKSEKIKKFISAFNLKVGEMRKKGLIKKILGPSYVE